MTTESNHHRTSLLLASLGGLLVVIGILALVIASWDSFTPLGRILTATLPLAALYGLSWYATRHEASRTIAGYTLLTSSIIAPFVVGVILYQSGLYPIVDAGLVTILALLSAANAGVIELIYRDKRHTPLTLISLIVAAISLTNWLALDAAGICAVLLVTGALMIALGTIQNMESHADGTAAWHTIGVMLFAAALLFLPPALVWSGSLERSDLANTVISLGYVASSLLLLLLAVLYSRTWQQHRQWFFAYDIRRFAENVSALLLTGPAIVITCSSSEAGVFLTLLGSSLVSIGISTKVRVGWFRYLGVTGIAVAIIRLIVLGLRDLAAIWPIVLVSLGILLVILAIAASRRGPATLWSKPLLQLPETSWEHLGEEAVPLKVEKPKKRDDLSGWVWFAIVAIILVALAQL